MAVYTELDKDTLILLIKNYEIGELISFEGIIEGVENTNYKIITTKNKFILTIFEKRVNEEELPFFIELQNHLSSKKIFCPEPIKDKKNKFINEIHNKKYVITTFLEGKMIDQPNKKQCEQVGLELAKIHQNTKDFKLKRKNTLHFSNWQEILEKCKKSSLIEESIESKSYNSIIKYRDLFEPIQNELNFLEKCWPKTLPKGIIHADAFKDNVFFINGKLTGLIDFYFACNDFYAYELAICINDWCFDNLKNFKIQSYESILKGYELIRKLSIKEIETMPILLRGAAIRFLLTRLHDQLYKLKNALVKPKDPMEYYIILKMHQDMQNKT